MEGYNHHKRAVRIARRGVAPSPHVLRLREPEPTGAPRDPLGPRVAAAAVRAAVRERVRNHIAMHMRQFARAKDAMLRSRDRVHGHASNAWHVGRRVRSRIGSMLGGRVARARVEDAVLPQPTGSQAYLPSRQARGLVVVTGMIVLLASPFALVPGAYVMARAQDQMHMHKQLMGALITRTAQAVSAGDFDRAGRLLDLARAHAETLRMLAGPVRPYAWYPPIGRTLRALDAFPHAAQASEYVLAHARAFPWTKETVDAAAVALEGFERMASVRSSARHGDTRDVFTVADDVLALARAAFGTRESRFLFMFQNDRELRPTGGFLGSFAILTFRNGTVSLEMPSQGSYALQGWLTSNVRAPEPFALINPRFEFQDSNWFPDFPTSARKIISFYESAGGGTVDGVVAVTSSGFEHLLALLGPITVPTIAPLPLTSETAVDALEAAVARDRVSAHPKAVLGDLTDAVVARIRSGAVAPETLLMLGVRALAEKDVQLYFHGSRAQAAAARFGWTGSIPDRWKQDFLMVVSANMAGGKTDGAIADDVGYAVEVTDAGDMIGHVTLTRTHRGVKGDVFSGARNVSFVRMYVPRGAVLLGAEGWSPFPSWRASEPDTVLVPDPDVRATELTQVRHSENGTVVAEEAGKTVLGNWLIIDPGQTKVAVFTYMLPYHVVRDAPFSYAIRFEQQAGTHRTVNFSVHAPSMSIRPDGEDHALGDYHYRAPWRATMIQRVTLMPPASL